MTVLLSPVDEIAGLTHEDWFAHELGAVRLGDPRRTERVVRLITALAAQPTASLPKACGSWADLKAAYRLLEGGRPGRAVRTQAKRPAPPSDGPSPDPPVAAPDSARTDAPPDDPVPAVRKAGRPAMPSPNLPAAVRAAHIERTWERLAGQRLLLAVQDTTSLDLSAQSATEGLGPIGQGRQVGLEVPTTLAVTVDGIPQGLLAQQVWARDPEQRGSRRQRRSKATVDKESQKWLTALAESRAMTPQDVTLVAVCDREADLFDFLVQAHQMPQTEALVRAAQGTRRVGEELGSVRAQVEGQPEAGRYLLEVPRADERAARQAVMTVRFTGLTVLAPKGRKKDSVALPSVPLWAILVQEEAPPAGSEAVEWLLLTTLPVEDQETALQLVQWYCWRWRIERYHLVLKSGCRMEERQLGTRSGLEGLLALFSVIAVRLLQLQYLSRTTPEEPAAGVVTEEEWQVVWAVRHPGTPAPEQPTLRQAVREIAGLGGFLGRKGDGEPGVITLWRGLIRLHDLLQGYHLARRLLPYHSVGNA